MQDSDLSSGRGQGRLKARVLQGMASLAWKDIEILTCFMSLPICGKLAQERSDIDIFSKSGRAYCVSAIIGDYLQNSDPNSQSGKLVLKVLASLAEVSGPTRKLPEKDLNHSPIRDESNAIPLSEERTTSDITSLDKSGSGEPLVKRRRTSCHSDSTEATPSVPSDRDACADDILWNTGLICLGKRRCPALELRKEGRSIVALKPVRHVPSNTRNVLDKYIEFIDGTPKLSPKFMGNVGIRCRNCQLCAEFMQHPRIGKGFCKPFGRSGGFKTWSVAVHILLGKGGEFPDIFYPYGFKIGQGFRTQDMIESDILHSTVRLSDLKDGSKRYFQRAFQAIERGDDCDTSLLGHTASELHSKPKPAGDYYPYNRKGLNRK